MGGAAAEKAEDIAALGVGFPAFRKDDPFDRAAGERRDAAADAVGQGELFAWIAVGAGGEIRGLAAVSGEERAARFVDTALHAVEHAVFRGEAGVAPGD